MEVNKPFVHELVKEIQNRDVTWLYNAHDEPQFQQDMKPFDTIENMTIQRVSQLFELTNLVENNEY